MCSTIVKIPEFFLVGAAKSGTSSLYMYLTQHPRVFVPPVKEPHFFSDFHHPALAYIDSLDKYLALFEACPPGALAGDASTSYLYSHGAPGKIKALQPEARILAILRNPIDRAYSFYWHNRRDFHEPLSFEAALDAEPERISQRAGFASHYLRSGLYHDQVRNYLDAFGRDRVRIWLTEDLQADATAVCREAFEFLGVEPLAVDTSTIYNRSGPVRSQALGRLLFLKFPGRRKLGKAFPALAKQVRWRLIQRNMGAPPAMQPETRRRLIGAFREDVLKLQDLLGRDLGHWLEP